MSTMNAPAARRLRFRRPSPLHLILLPIALVMVAPLLWMVLLSVSTEAESRRFPPGLPSGIEWHNYTDALRDAPLGHWLGNSAIVSVSCVVGNLVFCSLAGYAFARMRFRGSTFIFVAMMATLVVPFQLTMIPTFLIMRHLGLINTLGALIVPWLVTPFGVFLLRQFFLSVPKEIEEAARIDGCSRLKVLFTVVLPLARPALATLAVLTFLSVWNDLSWPIIAISSEPHFTLQLGLTTFQGQHRTQWSAVMAGNVLVTLPIVLAFLLAQRTFIRSLTSSAVKG